MLHDSRFIGRIRKVAGVVALIGAAALALLIGVYAVRAATARNVETLAFAPEGQWVTPAPLMGTVDLNTADVETLMTLPGIGEHLAGEIVAARERCPFTYLEDLGTIPGIGEKRLEALRPLVCISSPEDP